MAHYVNCAFCGERFDRDKEAYVLTGSRRYGQASCYYRELEKNSKQKELEVIDPTAIVKCKFCGKEFNKNLEPFQLLSNGKFAHQACFEAEEKRELTDEEKLYRYLQQLFGKDQVNSRIFKQIAIFVSKYGFTYSGIHKTLIYAYEIKHNDIKKANGGISIVEYLYQEAFNYYYNLQKANERNQDKNIDEYKPEVIEIIIKPPTAKIKKRKLFSFLDLEE
jgi:hypothetical protein